MAAFQLKDAFSPKWVGNFKTNYQLKPIYQLKDLSFYFRFSKIKECADFKYSKLYYYMSDTGMQRTANPINRRKFKDDVIKLRKDVTVNFFDAIMVKQTHNSIKKWLLSLWWMSNKTIVQVGNITKTATFKNFLLCYKNTQSLLLVTVLFNIFIRQTSTNDFCGYIKIWVARFL